VGTLKSVKENLQMSEMSYTILEGRISNFEKIAYTISKQFNYRFDLECNKYALKITVLASSDNKPWEDLELIGFWSNSFEVFAVVMGTLEGTLINKLKNGEIHVRMSSIRLSEHRNPIKKLKPIPIEV
jgi:hypothetical protein